MNLVMSIFGKYYADNNIDKLFNGKYDPEDFIVMKHLGMCACAFILGIAFAFVILSIISKKGHITDFVKESDAINIPQDGKNVYLFRRPKDISEFNMLIIAYFYLKISGKSVCILHRNLKIAIKLITAIFIIIIILCNIHLINSIVIYAPVPVST